MLTHIVLGGIPLRFEGCVEWRGFVVGCGSREEGERMVAMQAIHESLNSYVWFDICALHYIKGFRHDTLASWVHPLHCQRLSKKQKKSLTLYLLNYLVCPEGDEIDVLMAYDEYEILFLSKRTLWGKIKQLICKGHIRGV